MLCFEELTDEELSEYINSFQNDTEKKLDMKKKIAEYICGIRKGLQQNAGTLKKIEKTLREEENCDKSDKKVISQETLRKAEHLNIDFDRLAIYYNTTMNKVRIFENGQWKSIQTS